MISLQLLQKGRFEQSEPLVQTKSLLLLSTAPDRPTRSGRASPVRNDSHTALFTSFCLVLSNVIRGNNNNVACLLVYCCVRGLAEIMKSQ